MDSTVAHTRIRQAKPLQATQVSTNFTAYYCRFTTLS